MRRRIRRRTVYCAAPDAAPYGAVRRRIRCEKTSMYTAPYSNPNGAVFCTSVLKTEHVSWAAGASSHVTLLTCPMSNLNGYFYWMFVCWLFGVEVGLQFNRDTVIVSVDSIVVVISPPNRLYAKNCSVLMPGRCHGVLRVWLNPHLPPGSSVRFAQNQREIIGFSLPEYTQSSAVVLSSW